MGSKLIITQNMQHIIQISLPKVIILLKPLQQVKEVLFFLRMKKSQTRIKEIRNNSMQVTKKEGPWYYEVNEPGMNFRITDFQCALGISQLKKLDNFILSRRKIAKIYLKN